jgi:hypothetical protein
LTGDRIEYRFELAFRAHVERQEDGRLQHARARLDEGARLLVQICDGNVGAKPKERLRAAVGDRMLVGDVDVRGPAAFEHWTRNFQRHDCFSFNLTSVKVSGVLGGLAN